MSERAIQTPDAELLALAAECDALARDHPAQAEAAAVLAACATDAAVHPGTFIQAAWVKVVRSWVEELRARAGEREAR